MVRKRLYAEDRGLQVPMDLEHRPVTSSGKAASGPDPRIRHRIQIGMFRPIRVDHTNCLQVAIKTHSFRSGSVRHFLLYGGSQRQREKITIVTTSQKPSGTFLSEKNLCIMWGCQRFTRQGTLPTEVHQIGLLEPGICTRSFVTVKIHSSLSGSFSTHQTPCLLRQEGISVFHGRYEITPSQYPLSPLLLHPCSSTSPCCYPPLDTVSRCRPPRTSVFPRTSFDRPSVFWEILPSSFAE